MSFLSQEQIQVLGFKSIGNYVQISDKASFHNPANISIGDFSRIDDFCVLSAGDGGIRIGRYVHIACFCSLIGRGAIVLEDFAGLSSRVAIYSSSDDYGGEFMTNPTLPEHLRATVHGPVRLGRHVVIGVGCAILPNVTMAEGAAAAAFSLITGPVEAFALVGGLPAKKIRDRSRGLMTLAETFLSQPR